jgi:hypothetical protein
VTAHTRDTRGRPALVCACDCGSTKQVTLRPSHFAGGESRSCGCLRREVRKATAYPKGSTHLRGANPYKAQAKNQIILDYVSEVILPAQAAYLPLTVRQIYYLLVAPGVISKSEERYRNLCRILARERRAGRIPFDVVRDDGQDTYASAVYTGTPDFWQQERGRIESYRVDRQDGQAQYIELWAETAGMAPQLTRVADGFSVPVWTGGGQTSVTARRQIADRALERDVPTLILHVGDLDPHGKIIYQVLIEDAAEWVDDLDGGYALTGRRLALTPEQVDEYGLQDDNGKVQLEALPPETLAEIIRQALIDTFDEGALLKQTDAEDAHRQELSGALDELLDPPAPKRPYVPRQYLYDDVLPPRRRRR